MIDSSNTVMVVDGFLSWRTSAACRWLALVVSHCRHIRGFKVRLAFSRILSCISRRERTTSIALAGHEKELSLYGFDRSLREKTTDLPWRPPNARCCFGNCTSLRSPANSSSHESIQSHLKNPNNIHKSCKACSAGVVLVTLPLTNSKVRAEANTYQVNSVVKVDLFTSCVARDAYHS